LNEFEDLEQQPPVFADLATTVGKITLARPFSAVPKGDVLVGSVIWLLERHKTEHFGAEQKAWALVCDGQPPR
jgi:hypothetical protein